MGDWAWGTTSLPRPDVTQHVTTCLTCHKPSQPSHPVDASQVNLKLFTPEPNRKKTVLLFVIRDKTKTPLNKLIEVSGGAAWED